MVRSHRLFDPPRSQSTPDTNMYDQPYSQVTRRALNILPIRRLRQFTVFFTPRCIHHRSPNQLIRRYVRTANQSEPVSNPISAIGSSTLQNEARARQPWHSHMQKHTHAEIPRFSCTIRETGINGVMETRSWQFIARRTIIRTRSQFMCTQIILPQVHLRKPCYDFSFL